MNAVSLSRTVKTLNESLVELVLNGWMSGSYTGAVLTTECHSEHKTGESRMGLSAQLTQLDLS